MPGEELDMGHANRDDYLHDYDPGSEGTGIFPVIRQAPAPGPGADRYAGGEWQETGSPGHYGRPGGYAAGSPRVSAARQRRVLRPGEDPAGRERPSRERLSRMRPDRWVIAAGSITGAVAVYVALTTAGVPAKPMPSPFTPATTQGAPARSASQAPVTCVTPGP
jgi:hypothetical protein